MRDIHTDDLRINFSTKLGSFISIAMILLAASFPAPIAAQPVEFNKLAAGGHVKPPRGFSVACERYRWLCESQAAGDRPLDDAELEVAKRINRRVNLKIAEISDLKNYGVLDYWTLPTNGTGDCEDIVLLKYKLLLDAGIASENLSIAIVITRWGENHAVLIVHHQSGDLVLDSRSSRIRLWNRSDYTFLAIQDRMNKTRWEALMNWSLRHNWIVADR